MDLLTLAEASEITRVPVATLRFWRSRGEIGPKSFKLGPRRVMYRREDVEAWIASQYDAGTQAS
jgi:predicted DNA-binding transcriptional regulator AlpA